MRSSGLRVVFVCLLLASTAGPAEALLLRGLADGESTAAEIRLHAPASPASDAWRELTSLPTRY